MMSDTGTVDNFTVRPDQAIFGHECADMHFANRGIDVDAFQSTHPRGVRLGLDNLHCRTHQGGK